MQVYLPEQFLPACEHYVDVREDFFVVRNLVVDDTCVLYNTLVADLRRVYLRVDKVSVQVVQLVQIERGGVVGNNIKEPFFVGVSIAVSVVVAFYQVLYKLNVTLVNGFCFTLVSDLIECVLDQHLRSCLVFPSCEL